MSYGLDQSGFTAKSFDEVLEDLKERAKSIFGDDIDLSSTSPLYQILRVCAFEITNLWNQLEQVFYGTFLYTAGGAALDRLAETFGLERQPATKATGTVVFSRSTPAPTDYLIPSGTVVKTNPYVSNVYKFSTTQDYILPASATSVSATVVATDYGSAYNVAAHTIQYFDTPVYGVESVDNPQAMSGGQDIESDADLRARLIGAFYQAGKATKGSLETALKDLDGVVDAVVFEDLNNHTATVYVQGGDTATVSATVQTYRPIGIPVTFKRPTQIPISVSTTVVISGSGDSQEFVETIQNNLSSHLNSYRIGQDVQYSDVLKVILDTTGVDECTAMSVTDGTTTITSLGQTIPIPASGLAVSGTHTVNVA